MLADIGANKLIRGSHPRNKYGIIRTYPEIFRVNPITAIFAMIDLNIYKEAFIHIFDPKNFKFASSVDHQIEVSTFTNGLMQKMQKSNMSKNKHITYPIYNTAVNQHTC